MKKLLIGAAVALPVAWAGATWGISNQTESVFDESIVKANETLAQKFPFVVYEKKAYTKGFTTSTAQSVLKLNPEMMGDSKSEEEFEVTLNHTVFHGPVMKTPNGVQTGSSYVYTTVDKESLPPEVAKIINILFDEKEPLTSGLKTSLGGALSVDLEVSPFTIDEAKIAKLKGTEFEIPPNVLDNASFAGITGHFDTDKESSFVKGNMTIGAVDFKVKERGDTVTFNLNESDVKIDITELYKNTALNGTFDMTIPQFSFSKGDKEGVTLSDLTLSTVTKNHGNGKLDGQFSLGIKKVLVKAPDAPFAIPESGINFGVELNNLGLDAVKTIIDLGAEVQSAQMAMLSGDFSDESMESFKTNTVAYFNAIGDTVQQGTELKYNFDVNNETGKTLLNLDLNYDEAKKLFELKTVKELVTALSGKLNISVAKGMIAGTPLEEAIGMPVAMGFAVDKETAYELVADLSSGELKVNGEPMPVLDMMGDQPLPWEELKGAFQ